MVVAEMLGTWTGVTVLEPLTRTKQNVDPQELRTSGAPRLKETVPVSAWAAGTPRSRPPATRMPASPDRAHRREDRVVNMPAR
jgi:hypothetical protein